MGMVLSITSVKFRKINVSRTESGKVAKISEYVATIQYWLSTFSPLNCIKYSTHVVRYIVKLGFVTCVTSTDMTTPFRNSLYEILLLSLSHWTKTFFMSILLKKFKNYIRFLFKNLFFFFHHKKSCAYVTAHNAILNSRSRDF